MKKAGVISLIFILLLTTYGVTINQHFCGGKLAEVSLYLNANCTCGDMDMESNCCREESEHFQLDEDYTLSPIDIDVNNGLIAVLVFRFVDLFIESSSTPANYQNYKPPLIERDIPVLVQSFLI